MVHTPVLGVRLSWCVILQVSGAISRRSSGGGGKPTDKLHWNVGPKCAPCGHLRLSRSEPMEASVNTSIGKIMVHGCVLSTGTGKAVCRDGCNGGVPVFVLLCMAPKKVCF